MESKYCSRCKKHLPCVDFHKDASQTSGLRAWCIDCSREVRNERYSNYPVSVSQKKCLGCRRTKEAEMFGVKRRNSDGLASRCLVCSAAQDRAYRLRTGRSKKSNGKQKAIAL